MQVTPRDLACDFRRAQAWWGHLIDAAEERHGIPARLLYAVYSRETNMGRHWRTAAPESFPPSPTDDDLTYFIRNAGDGGHGRGIGQVDDRSWAIPGNWSSDVEWQVDRSAQILAAALNAAGGDPLRGANRYNSGQELTSRTTDNYGPDVVERWEYLLAHFPPEPPPQQPKETHMFMFTDPRDGKVWLYSGKGKADHVPGPADLNAMQHAGIPLLMGTTKEWAEQALGQ
jgi:hypothetical protein